MRSCRYVRTVRSVTAVRSQNLSAIQTRSHGPDAAAMQITATSTAQATCKRGIAVY